MAQQDKLVYFDARARGEPIRILYALAQQEMTDERIDFLGKWSSEKQAVKPPLGQLPILTTKDGVLCQSNTISRYVAKKCGLVGEGLWDETLNDVIVETLQEYVNKLTFNVILWKVLSVRPEPENSDKVIAELREDLLKRLGYIISIWEERGSPSFLLSDEIQLADVWLYTSLEFSEPAFPDAMEITPWVKDFVDRFEANPIVRDYLAGRQDTLIKV